jgi:anti-sigma B factor antagonist
MNLAIESVSNDGYHLLSLEGDIDTKTAPELFEALNQLELASIGDLRIDMNSVGFLSSAGLRALLFAKQNMSNLNRLILIGANNEIIEVITKTGLADAVMLVTSHDEI